MKLSERIRPDCEAAPWVIAEIERMEAGHAELRRAIEFLDAVRASPAEATGTGAARDAWNWIEEAARKVIAA